MCNKCFIFFILLFVKYTLINNGQISKVLSVESDIWQKNSKCSVSYCNYEIYVNRACKVMYLPTIFADIQSDEKKKLCKSQKHLSCLISRTFSFPPLVFKRMTDNVGNLSPLYSSFLTEVSQRGEAKLAVTNKRKKNQSISSM